MSKKIIHDLDAEELMKIVTGSNEPVVMDKLSEAAKFIFELNIKQGNEKIPAQLIYYTYKQWKGWNQKRQAKPLFFRDFGKFFSAHRTSNGMTYLLNPKSFDLSEENYWLMRSDMRNEKSKKTKKS